MQRFLSLNKPTLSSHGAIFINFINAIIIARVAFDVGQFEKLVCRRSAPYEEGRIPFQMSSHSSSPSSPLSDVPQGAGPVTAEGAGLGL